jgi:hypothetical protein
VCGHGLNSSGLASSACEIGNESSVSIRVREFLNQLGNCEPLKKITIYPQTCVCTFPDIRTYYGICTYVLVPFTGLVRSVSLRSIARKINIMACKATKMYEIKSVRRLYPRHKSSQCVCYSTALL